jgi:alpha-1,2-mannosyltransferase
MPAILDAMRTGAWLTRGRMRLWAGASLLVSLAAILFVIASARGINDYQGRPIGTDFSNVYAAGTYVLEGHPDLPFDSARQHTREQAIFGASTPFYGWHYPPFFLFVAAALATLPYLAALAVWQGVTLALYLWAMGAVVRTARPASPAAGTPAGDRLWVLLALGYPAVFVNLGHGHNGFLTAALFAGALVLLDRRPLVAGALFGLLAYKPQFGLLIPLVLLATGRWRALFSAAATVFLLVAMASLAFGLDVWDAFVAGSRFTRAVVLEQGDTGWQKIQSVFAWVRMWGGQVPLAYAVQFAATIAVAAAEVWIWRSRTGSARKAAALLVGAVIATPYSLDYDLMVLAPAIAFAAVDGVSAGFGRFEKTALAALWCVPLVARAAAQATLIPFGVIAMIAVFVLILRQAAPGRDASADLLAPHSAG